MERTHGQLCTGFTDGLRRNNTYRFANAHISAGCHVCAVALRTDTNLGTAGQNGSDPNLLNAGFFHCLRLIYGNHSIRRNNDFACFGMDDIVSRPSAADTILQAFNDFVAVHECRNFHAGCFNISAVAAIPFSYNNILRYVYQTTCQITGVGCLQRCIGQTFTRTVRGNEVFQYGQTFTEVCLDRQFDDTAVRGCHQTTHTCQLFDLSVGTTGTGVCHHINVVIFPQTCQQCCRNLIIGNVPCLDNLLVTFLIRHQTTSEFLCNHINLGFCFLQIFCLLLRNFHIGNGYGHCRSCGEFVTQRFDFIQYGCSFCCTTAVDALIDNLTNRLLVNQETDFVIEFCFLVCSVNVAQILRDCFIKDNTTNGCLYHSCFGYAVKFQRSSYSDDFLQAYLVVIVCQYRFLFILEGTNYQIACFFDYIAFRIQNILCVSLVQIVSFQSQVIHTQNHILRGYGYRRTIGGLQQVIGRKQQESAFCLCFYAQRNVNRHLVTVEVGVKCGTYQRMQLNRTAFYQNGFKCLNPQSVQCRRTVQHNGMLSDNLLQNIPNLCLQSFYHSLSGFDVVSQTILYQLLHYKGLKQLDCHFLRQTALINFQFGAYNDNGTAGVVNTFAQQVLTETPLFPLQHIGKRFQRAVAGARYRTTAATIINQCVYCFLQHSFFVSYNNIGCAQIQQSFQTVVSVDNPSIQVIQVACCETAAVQLYHRTNFGRNYRNRIQNHPFGLITGKTEAFDYLQLLDDTHALLPCGVLQLRLQLYGFLFQINVLQKLLNCFCAHCRLKGIAVFIISLSVFSFCQKLFVLQLCIPCIQYNVGCKVQNLFQCSGAHGKDQTHSGGNPLEIPDMGNGSGQLNMAHSLTSYLCFCYLNAATVADNAFVTDSFIFTTMTFPVFCGPENSFAEQTVLFRFQCSIVNGFRFFDFTSGPFMDFFGRCQTNLDGIKHDSLICILCAHGFVLLSYSSSS